MGATNQKDKTRCAILDCAAILLDVQKNIVDAYNLIRSMAYEDRHAQAMKWLAEANRRLKDCHQRYLKEYPDQEEIQLTMAQHIAKLDNK